MSLIVEFWVVVMVGYEEPKEMTSDKDSKLEFTANAKAMNALLSRLSKPKFMNVMHCKTTKVIWDKLRNIHEGDDKVKLAKLKLYRVYFDKLKMKEYEYITKFFLRVDKVFNFMMGLGETIKESVIVKKNIEVITFKI